MVGNVKEVYKWRAQNLKRARDLQVGGTFRASDHMPTAGGAHGGGHLVQKGFTDLSNPKGGELKEETDALLEGEKQSQLAINFGRVRPIFRERGMRIGE